MTERNGSDRMLAGYRVEVGRQPYWIFLARTLPISSCFPMSRRGAARANESGSVRRHRAGQGFIISTRVDYAKDCFLALLGAKRVLSPFHVQ